MTDPPDGLADAPLELRCAPWTLDQGIDPIGSAVQVDHLVTFEVPLPWPADIGELEWVADLELPAGTRLQATVTEVARGDGSILVNRWSRTGATFTGTDWLVPAVDVPDTLATLVAGDEPDVPGRDAPPEVLICGHGARDRCCGGSGTRLTVEARAAIADIRVRRTSHLGGHRFAPTALTLPDGRMWAYLDAAALVGIVDRSLHPHQARDHYRGHVGLDGWAQVVEGARLSELGWVAFDVDELHAETIPDGDTARVILRWNGPDGPGTRTQNVTVRRRYPVLQCGLPPEAAAKDAVEYELTR